MTQKPSVSHSSYQAAPGPYRKSIFTKSDGNSHKRTLSDIPEKRTDKKHIRHNSSTSLASVFEDIQSQEQIFPFEGDMKLTPQRRSYSESSDQNGDVFSLSNSFSSNFAPHERPRKSKCKGFVAAMLYGSFSAGMAFANKAILSFYAFNYSYFLMLCQMAFSVVVLETLRNLKMIKLPRYTMDRGRMFLVASMLYTVYSVLALTSLSKMSIAMYDVIKRCGPLATLLVSWLILKTDKPNMSVSTSILMITAGCLVAGYGDLTFDLTAYTHGAISDFAQALCLVLIQRTSDKKGLSATESLHINSVNALPLLLFCSLWSGEFSQAANQISTMDAKFILIFVMVISSGCILSYLILLCTTLNSALTTSVVGTVKSIVQTTVGTIAFGGFSFNIYTISGVSINFLGTVLYTLAKYRELQRIRRLSSSKEEIVVL